MKRRILWGVGYEDRNSSHFVFSLCRPPLSKTCKVRQRFRQRIRRRFRRRFRQRFRRSFRQRFRQRFRVHTSAMLLLLIPVTPFVAGLLCLVTKSHPWWERLNLLAFATVLGLSLKLGSDVAAQAPREAISALNGFL